MKSLRPLINEGFLFMEKEEIWKDIPEYEDYYQASTFGRIKSFYRNKITILIPMINNGYPSVYLCKNKQKRNVRIHQIVAITFLKHTHLIIILQ
jgi:hypothetical protein